MFCLNFFHCFKPKIKVLCPICYEKGNVSLKCGHIFCNKCLADITNCPLCRMIIKEKYCLLNTNCFKCNKQLVKIGFA